MSTGFIAALKETLPDIEIVFDHYHVSALINKTIDDVRREKQSRLDEEGKKTLKGSRYLLLTNYDKLDDDKEFLLRSLLDANEPLFTIHAMKEQFRAFWEKVSIIETFIFVYAWCQDAERSGIKQLIKLAKTFREHSFGLLSYFFHRNSCAMIEGINNKIKTLKRQAYGFRDMDYFKLRLYHLHSQAYSLTG